MQVVTARKTEVLRTTKKLAVAGNAVSTIVSSSLPFLPDGILQVRPVKNANNPKKAERQSKQHDGKANPRGIEVQAEETDDKAKQSDENSGNFHAIPSIFQVFERLALQENDK